MIQVTDQAPRPRTVYAVFTADMDGTFPRWIHAFTAPGYRHVHVIIPQRLGCVWVNQLGTGMHADWYPWSEAQQVCACLDRGWKVLRVESEPPNGYALRGMISCVSVVKSLLGLRKPWIITPRQLYRYLLKSGAEELTWDRMRSES